MGGRLAQSDLQYEQKYPAVLPQHHHVTNLIIREAHISERRARHTKRSETNFLASQRQSSGKGSNSKIRSVP
jgi:hypothetical protein